MERRVSLHDKFLHHVSAPLMRAVAVVAASALMSAIAAFSPPAHAQDTAAAAALFEKGLADMQAGKFESGCPALEESYRLDPLPGVLFTSAECHAQWGKYATATARYEDYLRVFESMPGSQRARQHGRDEISKKKLAEIRPLVAELTLVLPTNAPRDVVIQRDGARLGRPSLGAPIPVDPGDHVITTQVPGGPEHEQHVTIAKSEKKKVELEIVSAQSESQAPATGGPTAGGGPATTGGPVGSVRAESGSSRRTLGFVVGGIGVAGLVVGGVTGGLALSKKSTVDDHCNDTLCDHEGKQAADSAKTLALVSTIGFGVGAAGVIAGAVLVLTAPSSAPGAEARRSSFEPVAALGSRGGIFGLRGRF